MISEVRLTNFKSFRSATVALTGFTLIIGTNGSGKSNFFDALRLLRSIGEGRSVRDALEGHALPGSPGSTVTGVRGGATGVPHQSSGSPTFSIEVRLTIEGHTHQYFVQVDAHRHRVVQEELTASQHPGDYVFSTRPKTAPLRQDDTSPVISARVYRNVQGRNPNVAFSPQEFLLGQVVTRRGESKLNADTAEAVRRELRALTPLELRPEVLRLYSPLGRSTLGEHGENFAAAVHALRERAGAVESAEVEPQDEWRERLDSVNHWLRDVTPRPITELLTQMSPTREVIAAVIEAPFSEPLAAPSLSDGTLRFAALALAAVGTAGPRTLVIEELENGMNPTRIALLVTMLQQATTSDPSVQVIASTHSPAVLDLAPEAARRGAVVMGWDDEEGASRPVLIRDLPAIDHVTDNVSLGALQTEGWLQEAAGL